MKTILEIVELNSKIDESNIILDRIARKLFPEDSYFALRRRGGQKMCLSFSLKLLSI